MKKFLSRYWPILLILVMSSLIAWPIILPGYFSHHDDLQVMRIFEMRKCLEDFQIPCRWVPDMGFGNGYPLFNYYNVFPYYMGALASFVLGFIGSAKLLFLITIILAGLSMYWFTKELLGLYPALLAATLYTFAPYRALDIYVRGALTESFSIAIVPLIFYFAFKLLKENRMKFKLGVALSMAAFLTSHNIMIILFLPAISLLLGIWFWKRDLGAVKSLIFSLLLGFGLSAFFIVPAFLEKNLVKIDNLVRLELNFRGHFVSVYQLFLDRSWGYGASFSGVEDTISFQIGWPHYFLVIASIFSLSFIKKIDKRLFILYLGLLFIFIFSIFMTHIRSAFIWEKIEILKFTQFPWRFLSVVIFSSSLLGGFFVYNLKASWSKILTVILIIVTVVLNWSYFKPQKFFLDLTDKVKLSGELLQMQKKAAILDYLPLQATEPLEPAPNNPIVLGDAQIENFENRSDSWQFEAKVSKISTIEVPVFDFPNWQVFVNGLKIGHSNSNYLGRIEFTLNPGNYKVKGKFGNTWIRTVSNTISLLSILIIIYMPFYGKNRKTNR